jgi:hypothetical protein
VRETGNIHRILVMSHLEGVYLVEIKEEINKNRLQVNQFL